MLFQGMQGAMCLTRTIDSVCNETTGHAEVVQVTFDPLVINFKGILEIFFTVHDPTTLNRQGADVGTQYRSAIFYHSEEQKADANRLIAAFDKQKKSGQTQSLLKSPSWKFLSR